jgi:hypothetical protein
MRRISTYIIVSLVTLLLGVLAEFVFNSDYHRAKARYLEASRTNPYRHSTRITADHIAVPSPASNCYLLPEQKDYARVIRVITKYAPAKNKHRKK